MKKILLVLLSAILSGVVYQACERLAVFGGWSFIEESQPASSAVE